MREIIFKAKRVDNGEWIEGQYYCDKNVDLHAIINLTVKEKPYILLDDSKEVDILLDLVQVDAATVCQYTGLTDKNGVKIWEGDVVKTIDVVHEEEVQIQGIKFKVLFVTGSFALFTENNEFYSYVHIKEKIEVIGSIHDTLKGE